MGSIRNQTSRVFRRVGRQYGYYILAVVVATIFTAGLLTERNKVNLYYANLLSTIAQGESKGNYNAYYGHPYNNKIDFTAMTVGEVLQWQDNYVAKGSPSSAVGRYQFINTTLRGLVNEMNISYDEQFNYILQDKLAIRLLERRGVYDYAKGNITREQLAHNLSKEWAALPRVVGDHPEASYYDGDGLNKAQVNLEQIFAAIESLHTNS